MTRAAAVSGSKREVESRIFAQIGHRQKTGYGAFEFATPKKATASFSYWFGWRGGQKRQAMAQNWHLKFSALAQLISQILTPAIALRKSCDLALAFLLR